MIKGGCKICGGTAGDAKTIAHALCISRVEQGEPTPSLGDECPCCHGLGNHPTAGEQGGDAQWPSCTPCRGLGAINIGDEWTLEYKTKNQRPQSSWHDRCVHLVSALPSRSWSST